MDVVPNGKACVRTRFFSSRLLLLLLLLLLLVHTHLSIILRMDNGPIRSCSSKRALMDVVPNGKSCVRTSFFSSRLLLLLLLLLLLVHTHLSIILRMDNGPIRSCSSKRALIDVVPNGKSCVRTSFFSSRLLLLLLLLLVHTHLSVILRMDNGPIRSCSSKRHGVTLPQEQRTRLHGQKNTHDNVSICPLNIRERRETCQFIAELHK